MYKFHISKLKKFKTLHINVTSVTCTPFLLGSEKEVEEFEHLPADVAKERLRKLAVKMDRNLDGKIDKIELTVNNRYKLLFENSKIIMDCMDFTR